MPRTAIALSPERHDDEATTTHVDELIQRGRGQGYLSLPELRAAFEQAGMSADEARSIIRELTEAGVQLGNDAGRRACGQAGLPPPAGRAPTWTPSADEPEESDQAERPRRPRSPRRSRRPRQPAPPKSTSTTRPRSWATRCIPT